MRKGKKMGNRHMKSTRWSRRGRKRRKGCRRRKKRCEGRKEVEGGRGKREQEEEKIRLEERGERQIDKYEERGGGEGRGQERVKRKHV